MEKRKMSWLHPAHGEKKNELREAAIEAQAYTGT
jgi:hypothetical protein